jgi:hypothetical protein
MPERYEGEGASLTREPDRFSELAWDLLLAAQDTARSWRHPELDVEHLLLTLLQDPAFAAWVQPLDLDRDRALDALEAFCAGQPPARQADLYVGEALEALLEQADRRRAAWGSRLIDGPHLLLALLEDLLLVLGDRPLRVARELTKRHEEQVGPTVSMALEHFQRQAPQGECTLVIGGATSPVPRQWQDEELVAELKRLIEDEGLGSREATRQLAERTGIARRTLYALVHRGD